MKADKIPSYILIRSGIYYVRISIPHELRPALGKNELKRSLNTKDRTEAARRAPAVIASFQRDLERAKRQCTPVHAAISEMPLEDARGFARARLDNMQALPDRSRAAALHSHAASNAVRRTALCADAI